MSYEYVTQSSKCKYVVQSLAIVVYQMVVSYGISLCTSSRQNDVTSRKQKLVSLLCGSRIGSHSFERKASSDTLILKIKYYLAFISAYKKLSYYRIPMKRRFWPCLHLVLNKVTLLHCPWTNLILDVNTTTNCLNFLVNFKNYSRFKSGLVNT